MSMGVLLGPGLDSMISKIFPSLSDSDSTALSPEPCIHYKALTRGGSPWLQLPGSPESLVS